jgi:hypothetical protein
VHGPAITTGYPSSQRRQFADTDDYWDYFDVTPCGLVITPKNVKQITYKLRSRCLQQNMHLLLLFGIN